MRTWTDQDRLFPEFKDENFYRDMMTEEREREWVDFCFEAYEADGFAETFRPYYGNWPEYKDKHFEVVKRLNETDADLECLPMWTIKFNDGTTTAAWAEEICNTERRKYEAK